MIFIFTALYHEAKPIISLFNLTKSDIKFFNIYENKNIKLIITGTGKSNMSSAVGFISGHYHKIVNMQQCAFVNIGICGSNINSLNDELRKEKSNLISNIFLCRKIIDNDTNKVQYCDLLLNHNITEADLITSSKPIDLNKENEHFLFDMEGSAFVYSSKKFISNDKIFVLKIISDYLDPKSVTKSNITININNNIDIIKNLIDKINIYLNIYYKPLLSKSQTQLVELLINSMNLTKTQQAQLDSLIKYSILNKNSIEFLKDFIKVKPKNKYERNKHFETIKQLLLK